MADEDVYNLIAYLRSLEPVENPILTVIWL